MDSLNFDTTEDYDNLLFALENNKDFSIISGKENRYKIIIDNLFARAVHNITDKEYYSNQRKFTSEILIQQLQQLLPSLSTDPKNREWKIAQPIENGIVLKVTREFLKLYSKEFKDSELSKQNLAIKLGVPVRVFNETINPGFFQFVDKFRIDRYLLTYKVDGQSALRLGANDEIYVLMENQYYSWKAAIGRLPPDPEKKPERDCQKWMYGENGLQNKDMFDWNKLEPYKTENPHKWGDRYIFTFYACGHGMSAQLQGSHCWFGIANPEGELTSVGKYRMGGKPGRNWLNDIWANPLKVVIGNYQSPDCSLMWNTPFESVSFEISKENYEAIKKDVERKKALADSTDDNLDLANASIFHTFYNCTDATNEFANIAGVHFDVHVSSARLLTPQILISSVDWIYHYLPNVIIKVGEVAVAILFNTVQLVLGADKMSSDVLKRFPNIKPITTWRDLFNYKKTFIAHPWMVQQKFKEIIKWREAEIEKVKSRPDADQLIEKIKYQLPEEFYIKPV